MLAPPSDHLLRFSGRGKEKQVPYQKFFKVWSVLVFKGKSTLANTEKKGVL